MSNPERASSPLTPEPDVRVEEPPEDHKVVTVTHERVREPVLSPKLRKAFRHEDHWYLDGSVIIYVDGVLFRLHQSALVRKSSRFSELLNDIGDGHEHEMIAGCPVVEVDGNAEDFATLLTAMDDGFGLLSGIVPFQTLAAILRASTLYDFISIREWAVTKLEAMWPNTLPSVTPVKKLFAAESLKLAREYDVPSICKRVLYELVRKRGFGSNIAEDGTGEDESLISYADLCLLVSAREHLVQEWVLIAAGPPGRFAGCESEEAHINDAKLWNRLVHRSIFEDRIYDPLVGLGVLANIRFADYPYPEGAEVGILGVGWRKVNWCPTCLPHMLKSFTNARVKIWGKLDIWFGVPSS